MTRGFDPWQHVRQTDAHQAAHRRFRRAMRRYVRRVRRSTGRLKHLTLAVADLFVTVRSQASACCAGSNAVQSRKHYSDLAVGWRQWAVQIRRDNAFREVAFVYERAADALMALLADVAAADAASAARACPLCGEDPEACGRTRRMSRGTGVLLDTVAIARATQKDAASPLVSVAAT